MTICKTHHWQGVGNRKLSFRANNLYGCISLIQNYNNNKNRMATPLTCYQLPADISLLVLFFFTSPPSTTEVPRARYPLFQPPLQLRVGCVFHSWGEVSTWSGWKWNERGEHSSCFILPWNLVEAGYDVWSWGSLLTSKRRRPKETKGNGPLIALRI